MNKPSPQKLLPVPGFSFSAATAGIKESGTKDMALIYSEVPAVMAGVFTKNSIKAAPVKLAIEKISARKGQAIIINSGNANACTGKQGMKDAAEMTASTAAALNIPEDLVYVSSTGIIGRTLPMDVINNAIPGLAKGLSHSAMDSAAAAIMTTDTFPKSVSKTIKIAGKTITISAIAKGSGMICPDMATMLCYIVTDLAISPAALDSALRGAVEISFNRLSVDNDMSTNDTVFVMANCRAGNKPVTMRSPDYNKFKKALEEISYELARMIAIDGEGATKLIEIIINGAASETDAKKAAMSIANSMLVKTAIFGKDPNWGRIIAAAGYSGAKLNEDMMTISINNIKLVTKGTGTGNESAANKELQKKDIKITVELGAGRSEAKVLTCDLTDGYININAHYTT